MSDRIRRSFTSSGRPGFATTHWSVVLAAGRSSSPQHGQALETLCRSYWFPLYAYLRRQGHDSHQAEDYVQGFFAHLLEKHDLGSADPKYGKFRTFLLIRLKSFLSDERDRARAKKRGGGRKTFSLGIPNADSQYVVEPADRLSPEMLFEKSWALTALERTLDRLQAELTAENKQEFFDHLKVYLTAEQGDIPYQNTAAKLKMTEGSVRVAVHRLRRRYRQLLRDEIGQTVAAEDQIDEEMRCLFAALAY